MHATTTVRRALTLIIAIAMVLPTALIGGAPAISLADPASPLAVTNTASPSPVASGQEITYTITTTNTGGAKVDNLVLSDQLNGVGTIQSPPAAPQFVLTSTQGTCSQSGQLVTCNGGSLAGGSTWVVTIRGVVTAPNGSTLNNTASVTTTKAAQNFTTTATAQTLVTNNGGGALPDLTINKTGPSSIAINTEFNYVLTVNNLGTSQATSIKVVDTLPANLAFITTATTSLFTCTHDGSPTGGVVTCIGGSVNAGQNATITITVTAPAAPATVTNTASVDPENAIAEGNELNNTSAVVNTQVTATPNAPLLAIIKTDDPTVIPGAGPDPVQPLQTITYKIRVTNNASSRADDVVVVDGTQGLEAASIVGTQVVTNGTVGNGNGCVVTAPEVRCKIRTLNPGGVLNITIVGKVIAPAGTNIINTATVTGNIKNVGATNTDSELTTVMPTVDLNITKADQPDPVCASSWPGPDAPGFCQRGLKYTFVIGNSGLNSAADVVVRDVLPAGVIYDSFGNDGSGDAFVCPAPGPLPADNALVCTIASIAPGSTESFFIVVVPPATLGTITNTVTVDPFNAIFEADETNNNFSITTQIATGVDLVVYKFDKTNETIDPPGLTPAYPGAPAGFDPIATSGTQTYTIRVDNIGTQDATGIRVRDTLPAGTKFLSAVPDGTHGFTCTHDGSLTGGVVECISGHILGTESEFYDPPPAGPDGGAPAGNDFATITIKLFATSFVQPAMHNEVRVDPLNEIAEFDEQNNLATQDTVVTNGDDDLGAFNELSIVKTQTNPAGNQVATSSTVTYQIVVTNNGTDPAIGVKVRDFLPAGFQFIEATDTTTDPNPDPLDFFCNQSGSVQSGIVVNCSGATVDGTGDAMGAGVPNTRTIQIKATSASQPGNYTNQAFVDPDTELPEGNETNNSSSVVTTVKVGTPQGFTDLQVGKTGPAKVTPGEDITYTLHVSNAGTDPAFNVKVRDDLPANTTFVAAADSAPGTPGAFTCSYVLGSVGSGGTVTCTNGTLDGSLDLGGAAPASRDIVVRVTAPTDIVTALNKGNVSAVVANQAVIDPDTAIAESDETNNSSPVVTTTVRSKINLKLTKTGPTTASQNSEADYAIKVTNEDLDGSGGATAFGVKVVDTLPIGLIPLSVTADPSNFLCSVAENPVNVVTCVGDMNTGSEVSINVHVFVTANGGTLDNEACVDPDGTITEQNELDNCMHAISAVVPPAPDLLINKSASSGTVSAGQDLTYTINVSNVGNGPTTGAVTVTDNLPSEVVFVNAATTNGFTCSGTTTITCTGAALNPGEFTQIQLLTKVADPLPAGTGSFTNTASVSNDGAETNTTNNGPVSVTTFVGSTGIDLQLVSISDTPDPISTTKALTWTIVATNAGTSAANGAVVRINLPPTGITSVGASGTNGFNCDPAVGSVVTCTGDFPAGGSTTITVTATVQVGAPPDLTLVATVDPANAFTETDEGNNSKTEVTTVSNATCTTSPCLDLVLTQLTGSPLPVAAGGTATFTFVVTNVGDTATPANGAHIHFGVLNNFSAASITAPAGWTCNLVGGQTAPPDMEWFCDGTLAAGAGATFTITATASAGGSNVIQASASVDEHAALPEFIETNNGPATFDVNVTP